MGLVLPDNVEFREGRPMSTTASGVPYVTLMTRGVRAEGAPRTPGADNLDEAWAIFSDTLRQYLTDNRAKVVEWRVPPSEDSNGDPDKPGFFAVRARLAVTERYDG